MSTLGYVFAPVLVVAVVHIGGGKTNAPPSSLGRPASVASAPARDGEGAVATQEGGLEQYGDGVRFSSISVCTNGVSFVLHRPVDAATDAATVMLCATTNLLDPAGWSALGVVAFPPGETNVAHVVGADALAALGADSACFFAFVECGDADGDGLENWYERLVSRTDPHDSDTDGDGYDDYFEWFVLGTDPLVGEADLDEDGLPDAWETARGLDPLDGEGPEGGAGDPDGDGLANFEEMRLGTDPLNPDTDGDGLSDGDETVRLVDATIPDFDLSWGRNRLDGLELDGSSAVVVELPFPVSAGGFFATNAVICPEGAVAFVPMGEPAVFDASGGFPGHGAVWSETNTVVALRWGDFALDAESTLVAEAAHDGTNAWFVVEYGNVLVSGAERVTMRLAVCAAAPGDVLVDHFGDSSCPSSPPDTSGPHTPGRTNNVRLDYDDPILWGVWRMERGAYRLGAGSDPLVADTDGDGLLDGEERSLGTATRRADTDGDGLSDVHETRNSGTDPRRADSDLDGLDDASELAIGTDPLQPDTDGDGMDDGWEFAHSAPTDPSLPRFDPCVDNAEDDDPRNNANADPDEDGLSNAEECMWGTDPNSTDTDGDGAKDGEETGAVPRSDGVAGLALDDGGTPGFSDPADPTDGGIPGSRVRATFYFGDDSGSNSEKYRFELHCVAGDGMSCRRINQEYGECETQAVALKPGCAYEVRLYHAGTDPEYAGTPNPDGDYTFELRNGDSAGLFIVDDLLGLFGSHDDDNGRFTGEGKVATVTVPKFQIRVTPNGITPYDICAPNGLIDSRTAKVEVLVMPKGVDLSALNLSLTCEPAETGEYVNDGHGVGVTLTCTGPGTWNTSTIYWYGVKPDRECHDSSTPYRFTLKKSGVVVCSVDCPVRFPETSAGAHWVPPTSNGTAPGAPRHIQTATEDYWCCDIVFREFEKEAGYIYTLIGQNAVAFTWTGQYAAQIRAEELFHLKQYRGEVPVEQGGLADCWTIRGIQYYIGQLATFYPFIDVGTWTVRGNTADEARSRALGVIANAVLNELVESSRIMNLDSTRGHMELKAKERINYNACFRYHCTYREEYGVNPIRMLHPAYQ